MMQALSRRQFHDALQAGALRQQVDQSQIRVIPAPTGGLNARDAWSDMDETDAIRMENWYPDFGKCTVRPGSASHAVVGSSNGSFTAATGPVETLNEYHTGSTRKLLAAADGKLFDVSMPGEQDTALASGLNSNRWQTANMNDLLLLVNGEDAPKEYNGTAISNMTISGSGLTVANLVGVHVFKGRAYYIEAATQNFWYSDTNAHAGTLTKFSLGAIGSFGGHLMAITSWTRDGGAGPDDLFVAIMSSGEIIVYAGSDPGDASDWALVGVYKIGEPLGRRCATQIAGDVLIATVDGPVQLSQALARGRAGRGSTVSDKLGPLIPRQAAMTGNNFGWQFFFYPLGQRALLNFPTGGGFEQFVVNLQTGAWTQFRGWDARCWSLFDGDAYFGTADGKVIRSHTGVREHDDAEVVAYAQQAYNYLKDQRTNKQVTMVGAVLEAAAAIPVRIGLAVDFELRPRQEVDTTVGVVGGASTPWGSPWGSPWATPNRAVQSWIAHSARGYAISIAMRVEQQDKRVSWNATRIAYTRVGVI